MILLRLIITALIIMPLCTAFALTEALGPEGINAYAVHEAGISGKGVNIGLLSNGNARDGHIAFDRQDGSAVILHDFTDQGLQRSGHDTQMAGIIASAGSPIHPDQIGVAPGARVHSGRITTRRIQNALDTLIQDNHCRIIVTGIQVTSGGINPDGNSILSKIFDYYADTYDVIFANAAGNSSSRITIFGDSYNGITTAGLVKDDHAHYTKVGSISNRGPTADGRNKPDVAAPTQDLFVPSARGDNYWDTLDTSGRGLTSYAVPHTAGVAALLLEAAGKSPVSDDDRSEVIKAVMINSTTCNLNDSNDLQFNPMDLMTAWNPESGYGRLNALRAYETLSGEKIIKDKVVDTSRGWAYASIKAQSEDSYLISGTQGQRLIVTVTWHRKLNKLSNQIYLESQPAFYINLKILSPDGKTVVFEPSGHNNLIKTDYLLKLDGNYEIVLRNPTSADERDYGLAFELY